MLGWTWSLCVYPGRKAKTRIPLFWLLPLSHRRKKRGIINSNNNPHNQIFPSFHLFIFSHLLQQFQISDFRFQIFFFILRFSFLLFLQIQPESASLDVLHQWRLPSGETEEPLISAPSTYGVSSLTGSSFRLSFRFSSLPLFQSSSPPIPLRRTTIL